MTPFEYAAAYLAAFTTDSVIDWRAIHDTDKAVPAHHRRGTLAEMWPWLTAMNEQGYGIFCNVNALDGAGRELANVQYIRAHYVDLDNLSAQQNYERAAASMPAPAFAVQSSPGKYHVYWPVAAYSDNTRFQHLQRKMRQVFDGDKRVVDATRVMRVPGFMHRKGEPHLVTCHALAGYGQQLTVEQLEATYAGVNIIDGGDGERHDLGHPDLAAPSLDWLRYALSLSDPNNLDRGEWIAMTSAIKQSGWSLTDPDTLFAIWSEWCARYTNNDPGENLKQWNSIRNTELGWKSLVARVPSLKAAWTFGAQQQEQQQPVAGVMPDIAAATAPPPLDCSGEILSHLEQQEWFKGCTFISSMGKILAPNGRFHNANSFNGTYGGKQFIINGVGKSTNEAWAAATRSTLWTIPKVDHVRFVPSEASGAIITDALGRSGVNMYIPAQVRRVAGDASPFLNHLAAMIPHEGDRAILLQWMAHNVRFPGFKIPWAPVIQSVEGIGKGAIKGIMTHAMGLPYVFFPNAQQLTDSGGKFNGWMRNKLFILADEIKTDEKRDLVEVLKPLISEVLIEVQSKGVDQELEDNYANWGFFTNFKDAVPVKRGSRRYAIFYSPIQTVSDLNARGMNDAYMTALYNWVAADGAAIVADYLANYPIERGAIPMRAPRTSNWDEAVKISRTPVERCIEDAIEDGLPGFRGGWVSLVSALKRIRDQGVTRGTVPPHVVTAILEGLGYVAVGRAPQPFFQESNGDNQRSELYHFGGWADPSQFAYVQGW